MGKKSRKKTGTASVSQVQNTSSGSSNNINNANSNSTPVATVANVAVEEELMEPIAEFDAAVWEARYPFTEKTSDPQAKDLDNAHELFLEGIRLAKTPDLLLAGEYIASAFLRDLGDGDAVVFEKEKSDIALDVETFLRIRDTAKMQPEPPSSLGVLALIISARGRPDQYDMVCAMKCLSDMLDVPEDRLKKTPTLGPLGGLTHAKVYFLRGRLYGNMGNGKSALKDWTKALERDPSLVAARLTRLYFWMVTEMKTNIELHAECVIFLGLVHEDYRELDVIYVILAITTFDDPRLGTFADAMEYYKKSLQATSRRIEVYGPRFVPNNIICCVRRDMKESYEDPESDDAKGRILMDTCPRFAGDYLDQNFPVDKTMRDRCLNCAKDEGNDGIQLSKCSRCKRVYYCSEECIRLNWKEHKVFCNEISGYNQQKKAAVPMPH